MSYSTTPSGRREYNHAYYLANKEWRIASAAHWQSRNKDKRHTYYLIARRRLKAEGFERLGNRCACCGFDDIRFLTMDHLLPRRSRKGDPWGEAKRENWDVTKFQILCGNCNLAKLDKGACPHQIQEEELVVLAFRKPLVPLPMELGP